MQARCLFHVNMKCRFVCVTFLLFLFQAVPMVGIANEVSGDAAADVVFHFQSVLLSIMRDADGLRFKGRFERLEPGGKSRAMIFPMLHA